MSAAEIRNCSGRRKAGKLQKEDSKVKTAKREVNDVKIAYIGGGSRAWAWKFMTDLAMDGEIGGEIRLYDIDHDAA